MARSINPISFAAFMKKQKVISLYRSLVKSALKIEDFELRRSIRLQIRDSFKASKQLHDATAIKSCLTEAKRALAQIDSMATKTETREGVVVGTQWPWMR